MILKELNIIDFSGTRNRRIAFDSGLNIIEGPNESGKSTIASFIRFMLYGFADKKERESLYTWGTQSASGTMSFAQDDIVYRIEREYVEGGKERVEVFDSYTNATISLDGLQPGEFFLGVPREVFCQTAFIGSTGGDFDNDKLSSSIENILFSGDESVNVEKIQKKLDDARKILVHKRGDGGKITELRNEYNAINDTLIRVKSQYEQLRTSEANLRDTEQNIVRVESDLGNEQSKLDAINDTQRKSKIATIGRWCKLLKDAQNDLEELKKEYGVDDENLPSADFVNELNSLENEIALLNRSIQQTKEEYAAHESENAEAQNLTNFIERLDDLGGKDVVSHRINKCRKHRSSYMVGAIVFFLLTLIFAAASVLSFCIPLPVSFVDMFPSALMPTLILAGVALIMFIIAIVFVISRAHAVISINEILRELGAETIPELNEYLERVNIDQTRLSFYHSRMEDINFRIKKDKAELEKVTSRRDEMLAKYGYSSTEEVAKVSGKYLDAARELTNNINSYTTTRDGLAEGLNFFDFEQALVAYEHAESFEIDNNEVDNVKNNISFYNAQLESLKLRKIELEKNIAVLGASSENPTKLADQKNTLEDQISSLIIKAKAITLAIESLDTARTSLRNSIAPRLSTDAGQIMKTVTGGKYSILDVASSLDLSYRPDEQTRSVNYMSSGTKDVAYLSLRFALVDLLYTKGLPPLVFDESFSRLDNSRYKGLLKAIDSIASKGAQTLLFTSQTRDGEIAETTVNVNQITL